MNTKYIVAIASFLLGASQLAADSVPYIKRVSTTKSYKVAIILTILLTLVLITVDFQNEARINVINDKEKGQLKNNIDTIKESLKPYKLTLIGNKVVPAENYITINDAQNAVGINNGQIENNVTQTRIDNSQKFQINDSTKSNVEKPEIIFAGLPVINKKDNGFTINYSLKTKTKTDANYVQDQIIWLYRHQNKLRHSYQQPAPYFESPGIITNYTRKITYDVSLENSDNVELDTCYFQIFIRYKNIMEIAQRPYGVIYRISLKKENCTPVEIGKGKEYDEVADYITRQNYSTLSRP